MELKIFIKKILTKIRQVFNVKNEEFFFTKDAFRHKKFKIGDFTYGIPVVRFESNDTNLEIGKYCSIADDVTIFLGGNHNTKWISTYPFTVISDYFPEAGSIVGHPKSNGSVIIGHDVWIGTNVTIMSGVKIGNGAVLGAGAMVSKNVGDYEIWAGNPAKLIKKRFNDSDIQQLNTIKWWDWDVEKVRKNIQLICSDDYRNFIDENTIT